MRERELLQLINNASFLNAKIRELEEKKFLFRQKIDKEEIQGHLLKSEHNLRFVTVALDNNFLDWALTGCYYSCYHAALALIQIKGFTSKNHLATLTIMIKEFYTNGLDDEDIEVFNALLDYGDVLFYVESKNNRESASYSTKIIFDKKEIEKLRVKSVLFINKIKRIIQMEIRTKK